MHTNRNIIHYLLTIISTAGVIGLLGTTPLSAQEEQEVTDQGVVDAVEDAKFVRLVIEQE